jgi:GNAT superfamily N-acetyltransferase
MSITIEKIERGKSLREFVQLPYELYKGDDNWVPPLRMDEKRKLDMAKHPFWRHAEGEVLLAKRDGVAVGRMVVLVDAMWEKANKEKAAAWGWFECANDREAASTLFEEAKAYGRSRGCARLIGPMSPNPSDLIGTQIAGFEGSPVIMMPYNPPYHDALVQSCGNRKWKDLVAWLLPNNDIPERLERIMPRIVARGGFTIRKINMKDFDNEVMRFQEIYNDFERVNELYTEATDAEVAQLAKDLRLAVDPDMIFFVEVEGKIVAACLTLPDMNVALKAAYGRLFPFGIFRMLAARRKIHLARVLSMGVSKDYRNRGIDLAMYYYCYKYGVQNGYNGAEMSWVEEDNAAMTNTAIKLGGAPYRKYRIYEQSL